ncbi:MAG TPA: hypothetical protein VH541_10945 [Gaiellaceae bacterium]|jgi:hypothetical protein
MRHFGTVAAGLALALASAASGYAAFVTSARTGQGSRVLDRTYTCRVRPQHYIDVNTNSTIPGEGSDPTEPVQVWLDTVHKTAPVGGLQVVVAQIRFQAAKGSLMIDRSLCHASPSRVALRPAGLPLYKTVTPNFIGRINERCVVAKRVLVRFRITLKRGKPQHALVAFRNDAAKRRPVEFIKWSPRRITGYLGHGCTDMGSVP